MVVELFSRRVGKGFRSRFSGGFAEFALTFRSEEPSGWKSEGREEEEDSRSSWGLIFFGLNFSCVLSSSDRLNSGRWPGVRSGESLLSDFALANGLIPFRE